MNWKGRKDRKLRNFLFFLPFQLSALPGGALWPRLTEQNWVPRFQMKQATMKAMNAMKGLSLQGSS